MIPDSLIEPTVTSVHPLKIPYARFVTNSINNLLDFDIVDSPTAGAEL